MEGEGECGGVKYGATNQQESNVDDASGNMDDDESNLRPQKRKRTTKRDLSKGPTMKINTPFDIQPGTSNAAEGSLVNCCFEADVIMGIQVEEEVQLKQLTHSNAGNMEKIGLQTIHKKIKEYQDALSLRDDLMGQLQSRLAETVQQRDELITTSQEQETSYKQQTEILRMQLQQAIDMVTNQKTGVNPREHLELKNKLISLQQERSQLDTTTKQLSEELEVRTEVHGQLEYKYKQVLQKFKLKQGELEKITNEAQNYQAANDKLEGEVEQLKEERKTQLASWEKEKESLSSRNGSLEEERDSHVGENAKMREEIQNLMQRLQEMAEEAKKKEELIQVTQAHSEEQFGVQLTLIKQQMSELHMEEISKIKNSNAIEIAQVSQEIDTLQRTHEETINTLNNLNVALKGQLETEANKTQQLESERSDMIKQVEEMKASKDILNREVQRLQSGCNDTSCQLSESEVRYKQLEATYQDLLRREKDWRAEKEILISEVNKSEVLRVEVSQLEEEVKVSMQIEKECILLKEEKNQMNQKCAELGSQVERLSVEKRKLEDDVKSGKEEAERLNAKLQQEQQLRSEVESKYNCVKSDYDKMNAENAQLNSRIIHLEEEKTKQIDDLVDVRKKLEGEVKLGKEETERLNLEIKQERDLRLGMESKCEHFKLEKDKVNAENAQLNLKLRDLEAEEGSSEQLRSCIALLEGRCREAKEAKEEYEKKCGSLNDKLASLDQKLSEAHKLHLDFDAATHENGALKKTLDEKKTALNECETKVKEMVEELKQLKVKCEKIEKDKVDVEVERDKLMEEYRMMNAELASTMLALDREVQLSTHRRLSDIGSSLLKGFGDFATQTDETTSFASRSSALNSEKDALVEGMFMSGQRMPVSENQDLYRRLSDLEKENKDLHNEAEKLRIKLNDQSFVLKSFENKNSTIKRRLHEVEAEKQKLKTEQQEWQNDILEKLEFQKQLAELKLSKNIQEQTLRQQERDVSVVLKALRDTRDLEREEELSKTAMSIEMSFSESHLRETFNSSCLKDILDQSDDFDSMKQELQKALSRALNNLDECDRVRQEKFIVEIENISLRAKVSQLESRDTSEGKESTGMSVSTLLEFRGSNTQEEPFSLEKELQTCKWENERLQRNMERQAVLLNLEKQHLRSPKLKVQVHSIMQDLSGTVSDPLTTDGCIEVTMRFLRQAILKNISGQYIQSLGKTLTQLEDAILDTLHSPSVEVLFNTSEEGGYLRQLGENPEDALDRNIKVFTEKVEQLINVRTTLVDAANELVEQLEEAVTVRVSPLKLELEDLLKLSSRENTGVPGAKPAVSSSVTELCIEPYQAFVQEFVEVTTSIAEEAQGEKLQILQIQRELVQKILEDNKSKLNAIGQERLRSLEDVTSLPDAVACTTELVSSLEATLSEEIVWVNQQYKELLNQYKYEQELHRQTHTSKLKELESSLSLLLKNAPLEVELAEITSSHKAQLDKLKEDHRAEVKHLENQIAIQDNEMLMALDDEVLQLRSHAERDLTLRSESSHVSCSQLDNIKIQVTQRHLQSLYSDRDWYRRTVGLLSHVTLQLLHYFSVAESYIKTSQSPRTDEYEIQEELIIQQPESMSGVVKDLSFLSDSKTDYIGDNVLSTFPEDSAMSTALIGRSIQGDHSEELELASNSGSMLDSTVMSEGLLDDMDKDEQVRSLLTKFYPQLMSILKGRWDRVIVECLEKEVQELTIALQASAGMLKIFMHCVISENKSLPSFTVPHESVSLRDAAQGQYRDSFVDPALVKAVDASHAPDGSSLQSSTDLPKNSGAEQVQNLQREGHSIYQGDQSSQSDMSSHFEQLSQLAQDITTILSQEETFLNLTTLKTRELGSKEKLIASLKELCQMAKKTEGLLLQVHHQKGMIHGLEEERKMLLDENNRLDHYSKNLAMELQATKDQLADYEMETETKKRGTASTSSYAEKMEASKDTKERVRAVLSAKTKSTMDHSELVARNGDLERLLESFVQDHDREVEGHKATIADLSQQLEVADRQLRSSRQFLDEQANERERERDDLLQEKEKLAAQLREKDNLQLQHDNTTKEVESLYRDLQIKTEECEDALIRLKEVQADYKAAQDKISDQRDIISNIEVQLDAKNLVETDLYSQNEDLKGSCTQFKQENEDLRMKLEERLCEGGQYRHSQEDLAIPQVSRYNNQMESEDNVVLHHEGEPLSLELLESCEPDAHVVQDQTMVIEEYVKRISDYVTSMMLSEISASQSEEDLSERGQLGVQSHHHLESERALSPATFSQPLEERLKNLECTAEAAVKRVRDMQMTEKNLRNSYEEMMEEKNLIQERVEKHAMEVVKLEARLDEFRRLDHPQCAALQQKIISLQEELESRTTAFIKITQENEELKHALSDTRAMLKSREAELKRLQCATSQHSPELTAEYKQLLEDLHAKEKVIEALQREKSNAAEASVDETFGNSVKKFSMSDSLEELRRDFSQESPVAYSHTCLGTKPGTSQMTACDERLSSPSSPQDPSLSTLYSSGSQVVQDADDTSRASPSIHNSTAGEYPAKLEEDFKAAQTMLEAREEEILQLSEEMVDGVHQPLPSEAFQMQQTIQHLEEQFSKLQVNYENVTAANEEYQEELDNYSKRYHEAQMEAEKLSSNNEMLMADIVIKNESLTKLEEKLQDAVASIAEKSSKISSLQDELMNVEKRLENEKHELQSREARISQLTNQLDKLLKGQSDQLSQLNKDTAQLEQHYQEKITEIKSEQKRLISKYEEQMAAQMNDLSRKYAQEKDTAIAHQSQYYEAELQKMIEERDEAIQQNEVLENRLQQNTSSSSGTLQLSQLSDSWRDLSEGVKEELSRSRRLDNSIVSYMKSGLDTCDSVQPSTRASSAGDESEDIRTRLQILIHKIHEEGVQALSSAERRFLHTHSSSLDSADRSLVASIDLSEPSSRESSEGKEHFRERTQCMRRIAELEAELSKREREIRKLNQQAEFRLNQERLLSSEWKASLDDEKKRKQELCEQLRQERLMGYDNVTETTFLKSQLSTLKPKLQRAQEENINLCESLEMKIKQVDTLRAQLQAESDNFSCVTKALNDQRSLADSTKALHANVLKELQNSLKEERERSEKLYKELRANKVNRKSTISTEDSMKGSSKSGGKSDLQTRLAIEQEQIIELQRRYDRERGKVSSLKEQADIERSRANVALMEEQAKTAELTARIKNNEMEKAKMIRMMNLDKESLTQRELRVRELENKLSKMEYEVEAQTAACQVASHKVREEDAQLHMKYNQNLQKLGEAEAEICILKQKIRLMQNELELCNEREQSLHEELKRERTAIDRLGLPALARTKNLNEYFELQVKENVDLCKQVLRNMDERQFQRVRIASLEDKVNDLTLKLAKANSANFENSNHGEVQLKREIGRREREISSLRGVIAQREAELLSRGISDINYNFNERFQYVYGENLKIKSRWKSLVFQKNYLLKVIKLYQDCEHHSISRLRSMAEAYDPGSRRTATTSTSSRRLSINRFRYCALGVIAMLRMKFLVQRRQCSRRIGSHILYPLSHDVQTVPSPADPASTSQRASSSTMGGSRLSSPTAARTSEMITRVLAGGQTPPTRGPTSLPSLEASRVTTPCRNLFGEQEARGYDQYIERLDNIHSHFGINIKK